MKVSNIKLYTEEQVRKAYDNGYKYASTLRPASIGEHYKYVENSIKALIPIELPSDEEIEKQSEYIAHNYFDMNNTNHYKGLEEGAKRMAYWMREQILNQNK